MTIFGVFHKNTHCTRKVPFISEAYKYFSTSIFFGAKSKRGCERSEHPSSVYFWNMKIFRNFNIFLEQKANEDVSEASIWVPLMSDGYKYSSIFKLQDFLEQKANEDVSEASIRVPLMSEGYKYSSILQLQVFLEQKANEDASEASIRVPFISEAYKYFSILQLQYFFGAKSKWGCKRSEHPSSVYFWNMQIFFNLQFCNLANIRAKRASELCLFLKHTNIF